MAVRLLALAVSVVALVSLLTGCGNSGPSVSACKKAMEAEWVAVFAQGKGRQTEPPACDGLPTATLDKLAGQVLAEHLNGL